MTRAVSLPALPRLPRLPTAALVGLLVAALGGVVGCGHPATEEECKTIFDKSVEVEMRELAKADDSLIAKKKEALRAGPDYEAELKACVGKRVTETSMNCVRKAATAAELVDCSR